MTLTNNFVKEPEKQSGTEKTEGGAGDSSTV